MESNDKMRMTILHPGLKLGVFVPWRDVSAMTGEAILQEKVQQSNENFRINDGQMTIQITVVRLPVGSGRKPLHAGLYFESDNMRKNKQSIIQINNTKDECVWRELWWWGNVMRIKMTQSLGRRVGYSFESQIDLCRPEKP